MDGSLSGNSNVVARGWAGAKVSVRTRRRPYVDWFTADAATAYVPLMTAGSAVANRPVAWLRVDCALAWRGAPYPIRFDFLRFSPDCRSSFHAAKWSCPTECAKPPQFRIRKRESWLNIVCRVFEWRFWLRTDLNTPNWRSLERHWRKREPACKSWLRRPVRFME